MSGSLKLRFIIGPLSANFNFEMKRLRQTCRRDEIQNTTSLTSARMKLFFFFYNDGFRMLGTPHFPRPTPRTRAPATYTRNTTTVGTRPS